MSIASWLFLSPFRVRNRSSVAVEHLTENELDAVVKLLEAKRLKSTETFVSSTSNAMDELVDGLMQDLENEIASPEVAAVEVSQQAIEVPQVEQPSLRAENIGDELMEAINDLGKSAVLRGRMPIESNIHFMGAIRRLRNLQERQFPISGGGGLCHEARDTLEVADKLHRTLAGGN
jgi:sensor histidine kinase regulating citrate/malate metabolism